MRRLDKTSGLNAGAAKATFVLGMLVVFGSCVMGYGFVLAAERPDAPGFADSRDIRGVWVGQLSEKMSDGRVGHGSLYLRLQQSGDHISGVAGDSETNASPIQNAVLSGRQLKFSVGRADGGVLLKVELDANGDAMEGKGHAFRGSDNHAWDVEIHLDRKK